MKAPAFQFYVRDWISSRSIQKMTGEEVKAYVYLLCESWLESPRASLPNNDEDLAIMAKLTKKTWDRVKPRVMANFKLMPDDRFYNEKLAQISDSQMKFKKWGEMGGNPILKVQDENRVNPILNPTLKGVINLASATASATASFNKKEGFEKPNKEQVEDYAKSIGFILDGEKFCAYYEARGWKLGKGVSMKDWRSAVVTWKKNDNGIRTNGSHANPVSTIRSLPNEERLSNES